KIADADVPDFPGAYDRVKSRDLFV
ncbi:hypothetical protein P3T21_007587, partial [Paraburkholderia sp. GAS334]